MRTKIVALTLASLQGEDGAVIYQRACTLGCDGNVSKRLGSPYRADRTDQWLKMKNPKAPAVRREREIDWANR